MLCFKCEVRAECEQYKKDTNTSYGIWAGKYSKRENKTRRYEA